MSSLLTLEITTCKDHLEQRTGGHSLSPTHGKAEEAPGEDAEPVARAAGLGARPR